MCYVAYFSRLAILGVISLALPLQNFLQAALILLDQGGLHARRWCKVGEKKKCLIQEDGLQKDTFVWMADLQKSVPAE